MARFSLLRWIYTVCLYFWLDGVLYYLDTRMMTDYNGMALTLLEGPQMQQFPTMMCGEK